jgi:hypothetical protein
MVGGLCITLGYPPKGQKHAEGYYVGNPFHNATVNLQNPHNITKAKAAGVKYFQLNPIS